MSLTEITDSDFQTKVLDSKVPVLVDFWAPWCGPCRMAGPVLEELAEAYKGKVEIVKINVDENQDNVSRLGISGIPTTVLFKNGKEIGRQTGFAGKESFEDLIKKAI